LEASALLGWGHPDLGHGLEVFLLFFETAFAFGGAAAQTAAFEFLVAIRADDQKSVRRRTKALAFTGFVQFVAVDWPRLGLAAPPGWTAIVVAFAAANRAKPSIRFSPMTTPQAKQ
jgi:hypothetical protein